MRLSAAEPYRNKINIMDYLPKERDSSVEKEKSGQQGYQKKSLEKKVKVNAIDQEVHLSDDDDMKIKPEYSPDQIAKIQEEAKI